MIIRIKGKISISIFFLEHPSETKNLKKELHDMNTFSLGRGEEYENS